MIKINGPNKKLFYKTIRQEQKHFLNSSNKSTEFSTAKNPTSRNFKILNPTNKGVVH
jgi:hypothetical protein